MVVSFPKSALFFFGSKTSSGSGFFSLLFLKESFLRSKFGLSLFEVRGSGGMGGGEHVSGSGEVVDETEESSLGGLFVGRIFDERSLERLKETFHFVNDDS